MANGYLEKVCDFCLDNRTVPASRLGYRITPLFVDRFLGRLFETPAAVISGEMLRPEKQDIVQFAAGVDAIVEAQTRVARQYFEDGSVEAACPPLQALLHIMAWGSYREKGVEDAEVRCLFTRPYLMASDWYDERGQVLGRPHGRLLNRPSVAGQGKLPHTLSSRCAVTSRTLHSGATVARSHSSACKDPNSSTSLASTLRSR